MPLFVYRPTASSCISVCVGPKYSVLVYSSTLLEVLVLVFVLVHDIDYVVVLVVKVLIF